MRDPGYNLGLSEITHLGTDVVLSV